MKSKRKLLMRVHLLKQLKWTLKRNKRMMRIRMTMMMKISTQPMNNKIRISVKTKLMLMSKLMMIKKPMMMLKMISQR